MMAFAAAVASLAAPVSSQPVPLPTTIENFYLRGSQPDNPNNPARLPIEVSGDYFNGCIMCHRGSAAPIFHDWSGSLMAHAARDPLFYACLEIADADAPGSGDSCIRCHSPKGWLEGRSTPTNGSALTREDRDGVNCHFCHRLADPFNKPGAPAEDVDIVALLGADAPQQSLDRLGRPGDQGSANYVLDPYDRRRGPFPVFTGEGEPTPPEVDCSFWHPDETLTSSLYLRSDICSTCHDVSLPHFSWNGTGFGFNGANNRHPTGNKYDMVPVERTYSEWLHSAFASGGVDMGGRFGGPDQTVVSSCQDCHMPLMTASACYFRPPRSDIRHHTFLGASTWVLDAIGLLYGPESGAEDPELGAAEVVALEDAKERNIEFLAKSATLEATLDNSQTGGADQLRVRVINETGHKLPSGYPEGRRVWVGVQFFDCTNYETPALEYGHYDATTAELTAANTKVYEMIGGLDAEAAALTGLPAGPSMRFSLTNTIYRDNRIPPRGFTNANYAAVGAAPVGYVYADGQYWDDTYFDIPAYAVTARVRLYYQASSKEYIEFLRDHNPNPGPTSAGQIAYDMWELTGKSSPVLMAELGGAGHPLVVALDGDMNGDRRVSLLDVQAFTDALLGQTLDRRLRCAADLNDDDLVDGRDISSFASALLGG